MTAAACTCGSFTTLHSIDCVITATEERHAMINDAREVFYPDGPEDAAWFAQEHGARFLNERGGQWE